MNACWYGYEKCAKLLLSEAKLKNNKGETALFLACMKGNLECARLLLDQEAEIADVNGKTPLIIAQENNNVECCKLIE